jgi:hypothetical protein
MVMEMRHGKHQLRQETVAQGQMLKHLFTYPMDFKTHNMKKLILILFTFLMAHGIYSQGNNLQFNQVVNQDFSSSSTSNASWNSAGTITVEENKVLKITSCSAFTTNTSNQYMNETGMRIGDKMVFFGFTNQVNNGIQTPIWLASGTYTVYLYRASSSSTYYNIQKGSISGVEFNIVQ